jgi:hypothetical protein
MLRTPVPKTAIHEDSNSLFAKNEIRRTWQSLPTPPTMNTLSPKERS